MCDELKINEACVTVNFADDGPLDLYAQTSECYGCALQLVGRAHKGKNLSVALSTIHETTLELRRHGIVLPNCTYRKYLGEQGSYLLHVSPGGHCGWQVAEEPTNVDNPLFAAAGVLLFLILLWNVIPWIKRLTWAVNQLGSSPSDSQQGMLGTSLEVESGQTRPVVPAKKRLRSLDAFRGLSLVLMVFVNYGGGKYWFFHHTPWNGISIADLVFPWFVWIMGVSMAMALRSLLRKSVTRGRIFMRIVKRTLMLFGIGIMLNTLCWNNDLSKLRIPGVLQRLALSYMVGSTLHLLFAKPREGQLVWSPLRDVLAYWPEWLLMIPMLVAHLALTFLLPVPGCPRGYLGPGGLHLNGSFANCTGGAAGFIDRTIFGSQHIYQTPDMRHVYKTHLPYDPEGAVGCFTSIFLVFLGLQAGKILLTFTEWKSRVVRWCCWGVLCGVVAGVLCKFSKEDGWIPVNKNLWSVSFILSTASTAFFLLAIMYYLIDVREWWSGKPLTYPGMNSLVVYIGHELVHGSFPFSWQCPVESHWCYLFMNLWGTALWVLFTWRMYLRELFISV